MKKSPLVVPQYVLNACDEVWQAVGGEVECGNNAEAVELCLDADRLESMGGSKEANAWLAAACVSHGWVAVQRAVAKLRAYA